MGKPFTVNLQRREPYANNRFLLYLDNSTSPVAGLNKISGGFMRTSDVIEYREGGNGIVRKGLGRTKQHPFKFERGITFDRDFEDWANAAQVLDKGSPIVSLSALRKELRIEFLNEAGQLVRRYIIHRCWVSEYQALPDLDAGANAVAIEQITVEHEGFERDSSVVEVPE